jgi:hypothetical protein
MQGSQFSFGSTWLQSVQASSRAAQDMLEKDFSIRLEPPRTMTETNEGHTLSPGGE